MPVLDLSARNPSGVRLESVPRPLYPTRPDPTRPVKNSCGYVQDQPHLSNARARVIGLGGDAA